jgi:hypothetical protein
VGGVVVTSNRNIVAVGRPHLGAAVTTYDGFASGNTNFYVPSLFKNAAGSFDSALYVQNISPSTAAAITLKYYDMSGILTCTQSDSIPLLSSHGYWLPDQSCLGSSWQGSVKVESSQPVVAVGRLHNGGDVASYDGLTGGNTLVYVPMLFKNMWSIYNSTLTLQNTDPSNTANVTIDFYDVNGNLSGVRTYTIPAMGTISYWLPEVPTVNPNGFTFVSMGDSHALTVNFTNTVNQEAILNPNFVIFNGDLENDGFLSSEMNPMITALNNAGLFNRTFLVRGNHDDHVSGSAALWESYFETSPNIRTYPAGVTDYVSLNSSTDNLNYSFIYGNSMFIGLDVPGDADLLTSAELTFLDTRLTYAESRGLVHAFIYFHGPMYCAESTHCTCTSRTDSSCTPSALIPVINKHPIISAFFNGHEHLLGWVHMDNTRLSALTGSFEEFMTSPSGGGSFNMYLFPARMDYVYPDMTQYDSQGFGFVTVSGNSFTFSIYKAGTTAPVWTKTFTKGVH